VRARERCERSALEAPARAAEPANEIARTTSIHLIRASAMG
jgi:hypothetical protein